LQNYSGTQASTNKIKMATRNRGDGDSMGKQQADVWLPQRGGV
jgi:hypothetical protein